MKLPLLPWFQGRTSFTKCLLKICLITFSLLFLETITGMLGNIFLSWTTTYAEIHNWSDCWVCGLLPMPSVEGMPCTVLPFNISDKEQWMGQSTCENLGSLNPRTKANGSFLNFEFVYLIELDITLTLLWYPLLITFGIAYDRYVLNIGRLIVFAPICTEQTNNTKHRHRHMGWLLFTTFQMILDTD